MVRRSDLQNSKDGPTKRVRIKFAIPLTGGIKRLTEIHEWLRARFGAAGVEVYPTRWDYTPDAFAVHFDDPAAAPEVAKFVDDAIANPDDGPPPQWWNDKKV